MKLKAFLLSILWLPMAAAYAEDLPAFPGAEGFARYVTGGRGGEVYHVTNLNDSGAGSFRAGVESSGRRTIVFDVSGTIFLNSALSLRNGNVTIAGQTAPGDGICIAGYPFTINANNVIIRFMRFRLGNKNVAYHEGDGLGGMDKKDIMVDHCSVSWSIDECLSVYGMENSTVQWCIVSQSLRNSGHSKGTHGYGGNWGGKGASYHHNLLCHHGSRTPRLGPRYTTQLDERMDMRNNVIYNWSGNGCYGGEAMNVNMVNNYYKPGPATGSGSISYRIAGIGIRTNEYVTTYPSYAPTLHRWGKFFVDGNKIEGNAEVTNDNWTKGIYAQIRNSDVDNTFTSLTKDTMRLDEPIEFVAVTTHTPDMAFEKVLQYAGACLSRDALDEVMVSDTRNKTATYGASKKGLIDSQEECIADGAESAWPALASKAAPADTDGDGMPDDWEMEYGLDPNNKSDGNLTDREGYTMLELYMNELVADIMAGCTSDGELLGKTIDSSTSTEAVEVEISDKTYMGSTGNLWDFGNGYIIDTGGRDYASSSNSTIKFSRNADFYVNIPDGKEVTSVKIEGCCNGDGQTAYLQKLGTDEYDAATYVFPARNGNPNSVAHTIDLETPLKGSFLVRFSGDNQVAVRFVLKVRNTGTSGTKEVPAAKDPERLVDVYNAAGQCIRRQIRYGEIFSSLPQGFYVVEGEKVILHK